MKKKRITSKIIVVIVCLSIVLTLFIVPCFASSGYKVSSGSSNYHYRGIPFDVFGHWTYERRDTVGASYNNTLDMCAYAEDVLGFKYQFGYGYVPDSVTAYANAYMEYSGNDPVGMYNNYYLTSENYMSGFPYIDSSSSSANLNSIDSYHMFFTSRSVDLLNTGYSLSSAYYNQFANMEYYDGCYGCYGLRLSCDDILGTQYIGWDNLNLQDYRIYNFKDSDSITYEFFIDYKTYYFDNGELKTRDVEAHNVISAENIDFTGTTGKRHLDAIDEAYEDYFDFNIHYFEFPLNELLYESVLYSAEPNDIGYITNLDISFYIKDYISGNNPYLVEARDLYTNYTILGVSAHGIDINQDIVNDSLRGFYDNYSKTETYVTEYVSLEEFNLIRWLGNTLGGIMDTEIIGSITLGTVLYVAVGCGFVLLVLKFFAGG